MTVLSGQSSALAKELKVITTTTTLAYLVNEIGKPHVDVTSLTTYNQDPHAVEAKPSYMVKLRHADLIASVGLDLEVGWIHLVTRGARNPKLLHGRNGHFQVEDHIKAIEVPQGRIDRSLGDIHPKGNPHFHLDPHRIEKTAKALAQKLIDLAPTYQLDFKKNLKLFLSQLQKKKTEWKVRVQLSSIKKVITYHKSLNYFLDFFKIENTSTIEPKPGVPPSAKHIISLIKKAKTQKVKCILTENYFEKTAAQKLSEKTQIPYEVVPVETKTTYFALIETLVTALENCAKQTKSS